MARRSRRGLVTTLAGSVALTLATAPAAADLGLERAFADAGPLEAGKQPAPVKDEKATVKAEDAKLAIGMTSTKGRVCGFFVSTKGAAGPYTLLEGTRVVAGEDGAAAINADLASLTSGPNKAASLHVLVATAVWDGKTFKDVRSTHTALVKVVGGKITHLGTRAMSSPLIAPVIAKAGIKGGATILAPATEAAAAPKTVLTASSLFPARSRKSR